MRLRTFFNLNLENLIINFNSKIKQCYISLPKNVCFHRKPSFDVSAIISIIIISYVLFVKYVAYIY